MKTIVIAGLASLLAFTMPVQAQTTGTVTQKGPGVEDLKAATDTRIEVTKIALQLTPAQEKMWPALEEAIRARSTARHQRLTKLATRINSDDEQNPLEVLRDRADALSQRGVTLKKLVDAWQPLYETLDTRQKLRMRFLVMYSLREVKDAISSRLEELDESEEW
jgi:hypothetical protein